MAVDVTRVLEAAYRSAADGRAHSV